MATVRIKVTANLRKALGPEIDREMNRRATRVYNGAKRRCPVDTGRLRASIFKRRIVRGGVPVYIIGTNAEHGLYVHEGTGIYGPRGRPIRPVRGRFLVFDVRGAGGRATTVFARQVRGMPPRPFLKEALQDARG